MIRKLLLLFLMLHAGLLFAQTAGMIMKPASAPGATILDPDGDGYVSKKTSGVQIGFVSNDILESEISYAPIVKPDPQGDPLAGPSCLYNEIVGTDAAGNNAVMTYFDGTNLLFRFRLGGYASNSKGYSLLIDTDQKFGFTGANADPNAVPGNPGFEVEIVLETNFGIEVYNVNGTTTPVLVVPFSTNPYSTNCQKSLALTTACSDPDYLYDFYLPLSQLTSIAGLGITANTPLRIVAVTSMSPHPAIGNSAISDVGGITSGNNLDDIYANLVNTSTPTSTNNINTNGIIDRSACPSINSVGVSSTTITGSTTETSGSLSVYVYQSNGTTLLGSASTTFSSSGAWSINVSSLSPSVTLTAGQIVKSTITATNKGVSYDNCNPVTITNCAGVTSTSGVTITKIAGSKGYTIANSFASGTIITWYNSDFTLAVYPDKSGSSTNIPNPVTTTSANQTVSFSTITGQTFPQGVYYFTFQEPGKCVSAYLSDCQYSVTGTSTAPTITTSSISTATTSVSGTCASVASPGTIISLYSGTTFLKSTTVISSTTWTIGGLDLTNYSCSTITATAADAGKCPTSSASGVQVNRQAYKPTINFNGCSASSPVTSISGFSAEAVGTTITLYKTNPSRTSIGTTTVQSGGTWTVTGLSLVSGNIIVATASSSCLVTSSDSDPVTISTKTDISSYTIVITTPTEEETSVSGTISGGSYPVTLKVYVDEALVGTGVVVNSSGAWSVSGLNSFDLALGSKVQVTLTGTGCESALSSTYATVQCLVPSDKTISSSSTTICSGLNGSITVQNSQAGVIYTPMLNDETTVYGYSCGGNGGDLTLTTYTLNSSTTLKVKAVKFPTTSCSSVLSGSINFTVNPLPAAPTASASQTYCASGTTTLADLSISAPAGCSVVWYNAASGGSTLPSTTNLVSGTTYYAQSQNDISGCVSTTRKAITVQSGTPAAPTATANQSYCTGSTVADLSATLSGPGTISWYTSSSGGSALIASTALMTGTTYYAETNHNSCVSSTRTAVTVTLYSSTTIDSQSTATQTQCLGGTFSLISVTATGAGLTYQWYSNTSASNSGGTLIPSATSSSYTPSAATAGTLYYYCIVSGSCGTPATSNVSGEFVVNSIPTAPTASATQSFCANATIANLNATAPVGSSVKWYAASSGGASLGAGATLTDATTYYAESENNSTLCVSSTRTPVTVTINPTPTAPTASATQTFCGSATIGDLSATAPVGSSVKWYAASSGGASLDPGTALVNATIYYAESENNTTLCVSSSRTSVSVTINVLPAVPTASASQSFCGSATISNLVATAPVGSSVKWYAASSGGSALAGATALVNGSTYYAESENTTTLCVSSSRTAVTVTINTLPAAPTASATQTFCGSATVADLTAIAPGGSSVKWYAASTGGSALTTGTALTTATTYYAESENNTTLCVSSSRTAVSVTINVLPTAPTASASQSFCGSATISNLAATPPVGSSVKWYAASSGGSALAGATALVNGSTYYAESENTTTLCVSSSRTAVTITINTLPTAPTASATQTFCGSATVADLTATAPVGSSVKWYTASSGGSALTAGTALTTATTYYAESENNTTLCVSSSRTAVSVTINILPTAPTASANQSFCGNPTIANLDATASGGSSVKWYAASSGGSALAAGTALITATTYYAESENNLTLCVSSSRTSVIVTINSQPAAPTASANQSFCGDATIANLNASAPVGSSVKWYAASSGGVALGGSTALIDGLTYYAESENTTTLCVSNTRTPVAVTINVVPDTPTASATQQPTCSDATGTITITAPTGLGMTYSVDGSTYINTTGVFTALTAGTYSVTAKSSAGCISPAASVTLNAAKCTNLSIVKTVDDATPNVGSNVIFTLTVTNNGPDNTTGVEVTDNLPTGYNYVSDDGVGAYNSGTGIWSIGNLANGATVTLNITALVKASGNYANTASVTGNETDPTPANNTSTNAPTPIDQCNLAIEKSVNNGSPNVGDNIIFTLTATNNGPSDATGVKVTDNLPSGYTYISDNGSGAYNTGTGIWTIGNLANGASATLNITVKVNASGIYSNTATIDADQADPIPGNNSDICNPAPGALSNLSITKSVDNLTPNVGSSVIFTLTVINNGPNDASGVRATDLLPSGYTYISDNGSGSYNPSNGEWLAGNLSNGASALLSITANVNSSGVYLNSSTVTADQTDPTPGNNTATATTTPTPQSNLSITKTVDNATPNVGSNVVFTLTVTNNGPSDAINVSASDALPSGYTYISDDGGGDYNSGTGAWTIGSLANGASLVLNITAKVNASGSYANTATVTSDVNDPTTGNNSSTNTPVPVPQSNLSITKTVDNATPNVGSNVVFTLTVINNGPSGATNVSASDALPSGYTYFSDDGGGDYNSGTGVWTIGSLVNGASATLNITAKVNASGSYANTATVTSDVNDPTPGNNSSTSTPVPVPQSNLSITKTVDNATPNVGSNVVFTLTVTNNGPSDATNVSVSDVLPSGYTYVSDDGGGDYNNGTGIWAIGNLANGASVSLNITAKINATGSYANTATVTSDVNDPTPGNNSSTNTPVPVPQSNLSITKAVDNATPNVGSNVVFTLTVTNNGPSDATNVSASDALPSGYTYISDDGGGDYNSGTGVWNIGNLANGVSTSLNITAKVNASGSYANTATVTSDVNDPTPGNNSSTSTPVPVPLSDLSIKKSVDNGIPVAGNTIVFTLTAKNFGPSDATGVNVNDILPSGFTYISDDGLGVYNSGTGLWSIGTLTDGATSTLNINVTVNASGSYANTASISGDQVDPTPDNDSDTSEPTPGAQSNLAITKVVDNSSPNVGNNVVFTISVTNNGPNAATDVRVTDALPSGYNYISDNASGDYNSTTGLWMVGNMGNGITKSIQITAKVNATGNYTNTATVTADQPDPSTGNNTATAITNPVAQSNLSIVKSVDNNTPNVDSNVVFTLTVTNNGPSDATNVSASDALPSGYTYVSDDGGGNYNSGTGVWTIGDLANGASESLNITARVNASGSYANTATVTSDVNDPTPGNNSSTSTPVPVPQSNLSITKVVDNATPNVGSNVVFTLTVTNNGPSDATNVSATDVLPLGYTYISDDGGGNYNSGTGVWTIGDLANGASASLNITATVNALGSYANMATVTSDVIDPTPGNNSSTNTPVPVPQSNLSIIKTVDNVTPDVGANVVFTITVTNNGPSDATGVSVSDALPSGYTYVSDDSGGDYNSGTGVWDIGNMYNGVSSVLKITTTVKALGNYTNTATVIGDQQDPSVGDETSSVTTTPNFKPIATDDNTNTNQNTSVNINVLNNDTGLNDTPVTVSVTVNPTNGTFVVNADNTITYTPNSGFTGTDTFTYRVCDSDGDCSTATITIVVNSTGTDHQPIAADDNVSTQKNSEIVISILANDTGLEDGGLTLSVLSQPTHGTIVINADNTITYIPETGYAGEDSFTYQVCDSDGDCSSAIVTITIVNTVEIPEGFSPNGDGINDNFVIPGIENYNRVSLDILNRWGNIVYKSSDYKNNWDGTSNTGLLKGQALPAGTYFYVLHIHDNGKKETGYVYLTK